MDGQDVSRDLLALLLGPAADYVGGELAAIAPIRRENLARIGKIAVRRLGDRIAAPGVMSPRVVGWLLGDASYCEDVLAAEYWGGLLAACRAVNAADDRGVRRLALLSRLTLRQIRAHYLFYATLRRLLAARPDVAAVDFESRRYRMATFLPGKGFVQAMGFGEEETGHLGQLVTDLLGGLGVELLLDGSNTGSEEYLKRFFKSETIRGEGVVFAPAVAGVQLFLWVFGGGDLSYSHYLLPGFACSVEGMPAFVEDAALVYD